MKFFLSVLLFFSKLIINSQVGIGTVTPDPSSALDVTSNNSGFLTPRMLESERTTITAPAEGLLVYQTNNTSGFYYFDGTLWQPFGNLGDITSVTAGSGLTGGGTAGAVTLTASANNGLYVNAGADRIRIGGPLVENTTITQGVNQMTYNLNGTGDFNIQDAGVTHFQVRDNGLTYFGEDTYWRDGSVTGTNLARLYDSGNDGVFQVFQDGVVQHTIHGVGTTVFNERGLNYDTRIESDLDANMVFVDASTNRVGIGTGAPTAELTVDGWIGRTAHNNGALAGSYNSVGANSAQTNPIYVIGTNYKPGTTTLGNMYGIGYTHTNASIINGAGSWGMYVAADGDARIWLGASAGGESYFNTGGNFGLNTNSPTRALDVNGTVRIRQGNPTAGDVLMSQDGAGNATWSASGYGMVPIGSIIAWHGNMSGVPGLPAGWVECVGGTINDAASPMNGQVIPNLNNGTTSKSGDASRGRFLRGNTTSGWYQTDESNNFQQVESQDTDTGVIDGVRTIDDDGNWSAYMATSRDGGDLDPLRFRVAGVETRVTNMTVRWIMRIK